MAEGAEQEDRTEEPTARRLEQAIERGEVPQSPELATFCALGGLTLALMFGAGSAARGLVFDLRGYLAGAHLVPSDPTAYALAGRRALVAALGALGLPVGAVALAVLAGGLLQHRPVWTLQPVMPQWSRVSPLAGMKRVFGIEAGIGLLKGLVKVGLVGTVGGIVLWGERDRFEAFARLEPGAVLAAVLALSVKLMGGVLAVHAVVAGADALYQRFRWRRGLRMSKAEIKEEAKETDGNPEVKARMRRLRAVRLKKRMMAAVPGATVVIANPTHFAVALKYDRGMPAPVCVAKGVDALALRIRAVAAEHAVPVVENPPLARALHAAVEIDAEIPAEHYKAVAEVIGYVMRLRSRRAA